MHKQVRRAAAKKMSKLEIAVRKNGQFAGKSLVYRKNDEGREEFMVLLRQAISDSTNDVIRLWDHERYVYAHYNADRKNIADFLHKLGFVFPKSYKDKGGKEKQFQSVEEQFSILGEQAFTCESKTAEWDIVSERSLHIPDDREPSCNSDGEILYLHKPSNLTSVVIGGKTYYTGEYEINTEEGTDGKPFYETKELVKKAPARVVFDKTVKEWALNGSDEPAFVVEEQPVTANGLI